MLPEEPVPSPGETPTLRRVRSVAATIVVVALWLLVAPAIEWTAGRQFRSVAPLATLAIAATLILLWGRDVGFRRSAFFLLLVPFYGFYLFCVLIYRLSHLPDRYWEGSWIPAKWHWGMTLLALVGAALFAFPLSSGDWPRLGVNRSFEESVRWEMRRRSSLDEEKLVLAMRHGKYGIAVRESWDPSSLSIGWWRPVKHWYGTKWEPFDAMQGRYSYSTGFDKVQCQGQGAFAYCYARLPSSAAYFDVLAAGRTFAGSATDGFGILFASVPGDITRWRAFDHNGVLIAGQGIDLLPRAPLNGESLLVERKSGGRAPNVGIRSPIPKTEPRPSP